MGGCVGGRGGGDGNGGSTPYTHTHTHTHTATHWNKIQKKKDTETGRPFSRYSSAGIHPLGRPCHRCDGLLLLQPQPLHSTASQLQSAIKRRSMADVARSTVYRVFFFVKQSGGGGGGGGVSSLSGSAFQTSHSVGNRRLLGFTAFFFPFIWFYDGSFTVAECRPPSWWSPNTTLMSNVDRFSFSLARYRIKIFLRPRAEQEK